MSELENELLTIKEAAMFLKCSVKTLYNAIWRGELEGIGCGRMRRFTKAELIIWLSQKGERYEQQKEEGVECKQELAQSKSARTAQVTGERKFILMEGEKEDRFHGWNTERKLRCAGAF